MILAFILLSVTLAAVAQLMLKYGMNNVGPLGKGALADPIEAALRIARQPTIWGGLGIFVVSALFWLVVLSRTSLSFAYPFAALSYVLILAFDRFALGEPITAVRYAGVALIIGGLVLISRTGAA